MTKKSNVPENIFFRVLEKSRKKLNKQSKEEVIKQGKTLYEVFENEEEDSNNGG